MSMPAIDPAAEWSIAGFGADGCGPPPGIVMPGIVCCDARVGSGWTASTAFVAAPGGLVGALLAACLLFAGPFLAGVFFAADFLASGFLAGIGIAMPGMVACCAATGAERIASASALDAIHNIVFTKLSWIRALEFARSGGSGRGSRGFRMNAGQTTRNRLFNRHTTSQGSGLEDRIGRRKPR
jgi:hypothetical protein